MCCSRLPVFGVIGFNFPLSDKLVKCTKRFLYFSLLIGLELLQVLMINDTLWSSSFSSTAQQLQLLHHCSHCHHHSCTVRSEVCHNSYAEVACFGLIPHQKMATVPSVCSNPLSSSDISELAEERLHESLGRGLNRGVKTAGVCE